jgi:hypothetical protein
VTYRSGGAVYGAVGAELQFGPSCTGMAVAVSGVVRGSSVRMLPRVGFGGCLICWFVRVGGVVLWSDQVVVV